MFRKPSQPDRRPSNMSQQNSYSRDSMASQRSSSSRSSRRSSSRRQSSRQHHVAEYVGYASKWVQDTIKSVFRSSPSNVAGFAAGFTCALLGALAVWKNREFVDAQTVVVKLLVKKMLLIYGAAAALGVVLFPVVAAIALLNPGIITSFLMMVPLWAFNSVQTDNKQDLNDLFMCELAEVHPDLHREMDEKFRVSGLGKSPSLYTKLRSSYHFAFWSFVVNLAGALPMGSVLTMIFQLLLTSEKFGWNLLTPYLVDFKDLSYRRQKKLVQRHWFMIIGFALPFVLLSSIPVVNVFLVGYAQAGAAHLMTEILVREKEISFGDEEASESESEVTPVRKE